MSIEKPHIVVIGAGVIGLTSAVKTVESGRYEVTVVAETFPGDADTVEYTSPWAGAHHVSFAAKDERMRNIDTATFETLWEMSTPGHEAEQCFMRIHQMDHHATGDAASLDFYLDYPNLRSLGKSELLPSASAGVAFDTFTIDTSAYLEYLLSRLHKSGGRTIRRKLGAIEDITQLIDGRICGIIVSPGMGAKTLKGVEDENVYPVRGQTVLLRAPWYKHGRTLVGADGSRTYTIPRRNGILVCGGTLDENDWHPSPRSDTTDDILKRSLAMDLSIVPEELRKSKAEITVEDLKPLIVKEGCGRRPARKGGVRLEKSSIALIGNKIPMIFNYGHGGSGFQSSWGSATIAFDLLESAKSP